MLNANGFYLRLKERSGEQCYNHDLFIEVTNKEEAVKIAANECKNWYTDDTVTSTNDGWYEFFGGSIIVRVEELMSMTKKQFIDRLLSSSVIHRIFE